MERLFTLNVPNRFTKAGEQLLPALKEIQDVLRKEGLESESSDISLSSLSQIISFFYGTNMDSRKDVIMVWKALRRVLNLEATLGYGHDASNGKVDLFSDVAMLMQPDPFNPEMTASSVANVSEKGHASSDSSSAPEPGSVQETLQAIFQRPSKAFRTWEPPNGGVPTMPNMPTVLHVELHRQGYNKEARRWRKLTHKIALNETVTCRDQPYNLYGMIVHCGGLEYHEYYSVLRPDGPGTRWLKYAGETGSTRSVELLTTKQAVSDHEGGESEPESAAVAYIAIYVRADKVSQVLSSKVRLDILREAENAAVPSTSSDPKPEKMPKATPFRIGKRDWCAAFEVDKIYDTIRGAGHLSRSFYRTEGPDSALRHTQTIDFQEADELEQTQQNSNQLEESKQDKNSQKADPEESPVPKITVFVKQFDTAKQEFNNRGRFRTSGATNIIPFLQKQMHIDKDETWDFFHEHTILIKAKHLIKRSATLFDLSHGENPWDGILIIAQRRPTAEEYVKYLLIPTFRSTLYTDLLSQIQGSRRRWQMCQPNRPLVLSSRRSQPQFLCLPPHPLFLHQPLPLRSPFLRPRSRARHPCRPFRLRLHRPLPLRPQSWP